ncbi:c-type cytochrome [Halomonas beimenensis]|uniref:FixO3 cytochrome-c oxidase subunit n=1 Tax=Halomonas beimenensis TaxID=475662 RepID=A0A291P8X4_9GAMM|nr:cytochrome c [Halomonas beimenensis]ATJ83308.1 FixO3 cytochrome-c oxidase subunit [Halomonas beimenensis]
MLKLALGGVLTLLLLVAGGAAFVHSGMYNVAATDQHLPIVESVLHSTMHASVEAGAEEIEVPDLGGDRMIRAGAAAYDDLCAACHLKPGRESTVLRAGLNPTPPTFSGASHQDPAEQFWVIKNGIKMTGMPAWGVTHDDQELWEIVAFLQRLPELSQADYLAMVEPTAGDDGHDHDHGDTSAMAQSGTHAPKRADDGHDHEHGDMGAMSEQASARDPAAAEADPATTELQLADSRQADSPGNHEPDGPSSSSSTSDDHYADGHTH